MRDRRLVSNDRRRWTASIRRAARTACAGRMFPTTRSRAELYRRSQPFWQGFPDRNAVVECHHARSGTVRVGGCAPSFELWPRVMYAPDRLFNVPGHRNGRAGLGGCLRGCNRRRWAWPRRRSTAADRSPSDDHARHSERFIEPLSQIPFLFPESLRTLPTSTKTLLTCDPGLTDPRQGLYRHAKSSKVGISDTYRFYARTLPANSRQQFK